MKASVSVLFVCTGNICRSPTAEGVFRHLVRTAGLEERITADSAGMIDFHFDCPPDERACRAAARRGFDLTDLTARPVALEDFDAFDYILAMDRGHVFELREIGPPGRWDRIHLFLDFAEGREGQDVPDPYCGEDADFELVLDLVEHGAAGLLEHILRTDL